MNPVHVIACCDHLIERNKKIIEKNDAWLAQELRDFEERKSKSFFMKIFNFKYDYVRYNDDRSTYAAWCAKSRIESYAEIRQQAIYYEKSGKIWVEVKDLSEFHRKFYNYCGENSIPY
jgi:hypothetical protein